MTIATKNGSVILKDGSVAQNCGCCRNSSRECCPGSSQIVYAYQITIEGVADRLDRTWPRVSASQINGTYCAELVSGNSGSCTFAAKGCSIVTEPTNFDSECENFLTLTITPVFSGGASPVRTGTLLTINLRNFIDGSLPGVRGNSVYVPVEGTECPFDEIIIPLSSLRTIVPTPLFVPQPPNQYEMSSATATIRLSECVQPACNQADKCRFWCSSFGGVDDICLPEIDVQLTMQYPGDLLSSATSTLQYSSGVVAGNIVRSAGYEGVIVLSSVNATTGVITNYPFNISLTPEFCARDAEAGIRMLFRASSFGINFGGTAYTQCYQMPHSCASETVEFTMLRIASIFTLQVPAEVQILC